MTPPATEMGIGPLVERVARAVCKARGGDPDKCVHGVSWQAGEAGRSEAGSICYRRAWQDREAEARAAIEATRTPEAAQASENYIKSLTEPWANYHGDIPDYDHPLRPVFESGIQYAVELLAKTLGVKEWDICDGTEEFDGDLGGTLLNIVIETWPTDERGDCIDLRNPETRAALAQVRHPSGERM